MFLEIQTYPALNKTKCTMHPIRTYQVHAKKQENMNHSEERNQSIEISLEMLQMIELIDKDN